jgi:hypothetical protein
MIKRTGGQAKRAAAQNEKPQPVPHGLGGQMIRADRARRARQRSKASRARVTAKAEARPIIAASWPGSISMPKEVAPGRFSTFREV